jgi:pilus assembly protein CpaC
MHRYSRVPRALVLATLFSLAVCLGLGVSRTGAQDKDKAQDKAQDKGTAVQVPINGSQILEMSKKQRIKDIDNQNQNVARVDFLQGADFKKVMIFGGDKAGQTRLVLTDNDGNKETFIIVVELDVEFLKRVLAQAAPTANIQIIQGTNNTLILTGTVGQATDINVIMQTAVGVAGDPTKVVNGMRVGGVQQVQLDVVIARVARSKARTMGFSFNESSTNQFLTSSTGGNGSVTDIFKAPLSNVVGSVTAAPNVAFGILNGSGSFLGFLNALRSESLVKIMAQPKVCTLSGRPCEFISGGEQAVPTLASGGAGGGAVSGVDFRPFGTTVRFLPLVLGGGKIYLEVEPQFTFPDPSNLFSAPIPGTSSVVFGRTTQRVQTSVVMEDGQTFCIGGMSFHQVNGSTTKIPVLGEMPFLGTLFSQVTYSDSEEELIILVTPHLVDAMACNQLPKFLPGEETRSPDDFELFLERILEAPRGHREVFDGCCKYVPAYKNSPTCDMFPCPNCNGPRGACDFDMRAGPACRECQLFGGGNGGCANGGCANGGCANGGCANGGCANGGCGNGCVNGHGGFCPPALPAPPLPWDCPMHLPPLGVPVIPVAPGQQGPVPPGQGTPGAVQPGGEQSAPESFQKLPVRNEDEVSTRALQGNSLNVRLPDITAPVTTGSEVSPAGASGSAPPAAQLAPPQTSGPPVIQLPGS